MMDEKREVWLKGLKAGDAVLVRQSAFGVEEYVHTAVSKRTPTGRIVIDFGNYKKEFDADGRERANTYHAAHLEIPTPEILAKIAKAKLVSKVKRAVELGVIGRLTDEELATVWGILGKYPFVGRFEKKS